MAKESPLYHSRFLLSSSFMGVGTGWPQGPGPPTLEEQSISFANPLGPGAAYTACSDSELLLHGPL